MVIKNALRSTVLLSLLAGFSTAYATPGDDIKTATADVVFSSAVTLNHELHTTADAFRQSDLATGTRLGSGLTMWSFDKNVLLAQGKVSVASGVWSSADEIVVRFTPSLCESNATNGTGLPVTCRAGLPLTMLDQNNNQLISIDSAGWGVLPEHQGVAYYNVKESGADISGSSSSLVGNYIFGVDAAVFEN